MIPKVVGVNCSFLITLRLNGGGASCISHFQCYIKLLKEIIL